jgi:hypothetical protein
MDFSQIDPEQEARRIVSSYLNTWGWARHWRNNAPITYNKKKWNNEEYNQRISRFDDISEEAEDRFYAAIDYWREIKTPKASAVLNEIVRIVGQRKDLGFFAQKMIDRIRQERSW